MSSAPSDGSTPTATTCIATASKISARRATRARTLSQNLTPAPSGRASARPGSCVPAGPGFSLPRLRRQQPVEFSGFQCFSRFVRDDDLPAFTGPDPGLGNRNQHAVPFALYGLIFSYCDNLIRHAAYSRLGNAADI